MKSKAQIKSHPLHPILVAFPIAFFTGTLLFDGLFILNGNDSLLITARNLNIAGIIAAVCAAIPGIIDYIYTVPPASSAKKRATKHALTNSAALICFIVAWLSRQEGQISVLQITLEAIGAVLLGFAGWMGGTLVYRNQVGVDIRYANAGKWKEETINDTKTDIVVASSNELSLNQMKLVHLNGERIVIGRTEDGYVAFSDHCTHRGGSLAGGALICGTVQCPWHGSQFDATSGEVKAGPAQEKIKTYEVYESGNEVFIKFGK